MINRILGKLGRMRNDFLFNTGVGARYKFKNTEHTILMYHGVDQVGSTRFNSRHTSKDDFARHVAFLKKYCHIISLQDFFEQKFIKGRPNIALTFDDGYRNNYLYARPILEEAKVPGTFFITGLNTTETDILWPDFLNIASSIYDKDLNIEGETFCKVNGVYCSKETGKNLYEIIKYEKADTEFKLLMMQAFTGLYDFKSDGNFDDYWKLMTDQEIHLCGASKFIEIGSHGFLHNNLGTISFEKSSLELSNSKRYLENIIQTEILSLGYPDGSYSRETLDYAEEIGFKYQTAAEGFHFSEDYFDNRIRDRKGVYSWDSCANQLLINL